MVDDQFDGRGVLYPARLPSFHREPAPAALRELVRWFWIPRWDLPPGRTIRQQVLPFPASNLVVEPGGAILAGPTTGPSQRDLSGQGWAVGALLRPAAIFAISQNPSGTRDVEVPFEAPELHRSVSAAMSLEDRALGRERAIHAYSAWISEHCPAPDDSGLLANEMEERISSHASIGRVDQLASSLHISVRRVQRLAHRYVGVSPLSMIRRYRLQEAAQHLRDDPSLTITAVAARLGYADHAHLTADFRRVLGFTPHSYRQDSSRP
ncbi:helix-turn-helix domain-containing protein [Kocuria koreensis]|jgi:AraC-like DNA-binding protein|uniref:Helix-turn-helix domain-containing protein n=1 Tax=Rothia koreensis TaxID=592378 RepID=A0A7K1LJK6_9MICC|nr:helix-turn-helix domain-containing protein [Rothia koreensis]MUN55375.1 helix-turn-helix domain-containing protein [Rothia koreensis]